MQSDKNIANHGLSLTYQMKSTLFICPRPLKADIQEEAIGIIDGNTFMGSGFNLLSCFGKKEGLIDETSKDRI